MALPQVTNPPTMEAQSRGFLSADGVSVAFGGLKAVSNVSLALAPSVVKGLIGPNGAGKTTLVNILSGFQQPSEGVFSTSDGRVQTVLNGSSPDAIRRAGIARTFQACRLFENLTVSENIAAAGASLGHRRSRADVEADRILEWLDIEALADIRAGDLAYSDQRRVGIARAMVFRPQYLLLDEPAAGMSERDGHELGLLIRRIAAETAAGILLIEHNIKMVLETCSYIYVLDGGCPIEEGEPDHIRKSAKVRDAYLGTSHDDIDPDLALGVAS